VACVGEQRKECWVLVGKLRKRLLGKTYVYNGWNYTIKVVKYENVDRFRLTRDRKKWRAFVNMAMNLRGSYNAGNFLSNCGNIWVSSRTLVCLMS
jgi:hypothetical protein